MELAYLRLFDGEPTLWFGLIYLATIVAGYLFGRWAGPIAWRKIYVEGLRGKKYLAK
jgi:hypothetical protein